MNIVPGAFVEIVDEGVDYCHGDGCAEGDFEVVGEDEDDYGV